VELQNPTREPIGVVLHTVDGETLSTLGSGYAPPGSVKHGPTLWVKLSAFKETIPAESGINVPVTVEVPTSATAGDYLSGISIEALGQTAQGLAKKGVSIASVERYVLGVEVLVPGARHPLIQFTGATVEREPSGLTFFLDSHNIGNVISPNVHGHVTITRGGHTVISRPIEPGTYVTNTRIAYPVNAADQTPTEGTVYRIAAWMRYHDGIARLDTTVTFGHHQAVIQGRYSNVKPTGSGGGTSWWKIAGIGLALLYGLFTTILLFLRRKKRDSEEEEAAEQKQEQEQDQGIEHALPR
jgi:hypothetical protein